MTPISFYLQDREIAFYMSAVNVDAKSALVVVDVQNDFMPNGALPVEGGDKVIGPLNRYIGVFEERGRPIVFTRDWHPSNHMSFKENGGPWPRHCVQNTVGAQLHADLEIPDDAIIISIGKGTDPMTEAYSAFQGTQLSELLKGRGISKLFVGGLATDYCVKSTIVDALGEGFEVYFLSDASRGVNARPGDSENAIGEMTRKGARSVRLGDLSY